MPHLASAAMPPKSRKFNVVYISMRPEREQKLHPSQSFMQISFPPSPIPIQFHFRPYSSAQNFRSIPNSTRKNLFLFSFHRGYCSSQLTEYELSRAVTKKLSLIHI